jgi:serine O-acetyltransferase
MKDHKVSPLIDALGAAVTAGRALNGNGHSHNWQLGKIVAELRAARMEWRGNHERTQELNGRDLPSRETLADVVQALIGALFPMRLGPPELREESEDFYVGHSLDAALNALLIQVRLALRHAARTQRDFELLKNGRIDEDATKIVGDLAFALPALRRLLDTDVMAAYQGDPAARSVDEVLLCYPGVSAVIHHRLAHHLYKAGVPLVARIISELAHSATGIDIHPGAQIGASFFIDHGTGVVIGETAVIGQRVRLYQNVTLGAKRFPRGEEGVLMKGLPRHPLVEDDVVVYAGATILGRITIGQGSMIGGNVWLTRSVPPGTVVTQASLSEDAPCAETDL